MSVVIDGKTVLTGDGKFPHPDNPLHVVMDGQKMKVGFGQYVIATWFGGDSDPMDDGRTACGYNTKGHPDLLGCSLPTNVPGDPFLEGSPIPKLPFGLHSDGTVNKSGTTVTVERLDNGATITVPLIDEGPGRGATKPGGYLHGIDLTVAAYKALGLNKVTGAPPRMGYTINVGA